MSDKLITFCVPSFNSQAYLHIALDSLIVGQGRIEVLVIDDGSTDSTLAIAREYESKYPDTFSAIHQDNAGHGGAINTALRLASGRYFKVLDSDDWVEQKGLLALLDYIEAHPEDETDLFLAPYVYQHGYGNPVQTISFSRYLTSWQPTPWRGVKKFFGRDNITLHSAMYKTSCLHACGIRLPEHVSYEDNLFVYAPLPFTKKATYCPLPFYQYLIGRSGQTMEQQTIVKNWRTFMRHAEAIFRLYDITPYKKSDPGLYRIMFHSLVLNFTLGYLYAQLVNSAESQSEKFAFLSRCREHNKALYQAVTRSFMVRMSLSKRRSGHRKSKFGVLVSRKIVKYN